MEGNFVRFVDSVTVSPLDISEEVRDYYAQPEHMQSTPLRCRIAATHSGKITRNNGFYLPERMRAGTSTFTAQYAKPIQVHHDAKRDPIGRVVAANYIDLTSMVRDAAKLSNLRDACADLSLLDAFVLGKMSHEDAVAFACEYLIQDFSVSTDPDYEGLGYVELLADITDPDAKVKILDKRYLTGSTGASTDSATCSVCKTNWAADGKCTHKPGKVYDETKCVLIAGGLTYDEYSFVNKPADRHSGVIEVNIGGLQDMVQVENHQEDDTNKSERVYEVVFVHDSAKATKSQEDESMTFKEAFERISKHDFFKGLEGLEDAVKAVVDANKETDADLERLVATQLGKLEDFDKAHPAATDDTAAADAADDSNDSSDDDTSAGDEVTAEDKVKQLEALLEQAKSLVPAKKEDDASSEPAACDKCKALEDQVAELTASLEEAKKNDAVQQKNDELQTRLDAARKEVRYLHGDIENLTNAVADSMSEVRDAHVQRVTDFRILDGQEVDFQTVSDELKDKSTEQLREVVKEISDKVDTKKIAGTLNSGLSKEPEGDVTDPTAVTDNTAETTDAAKPEVTPAIRNQIALMHLQILNTQGETAAKQYLDSCKAEGYLEDDTSDQS